MKRIAILLFSLLCFKAKSQINITAFGGGAIYSPLSVPDANNRNFDHEAGSGFQLGLEATKRFGPALYAGIGLIAHRPTISTTSLDTLVVDNNNSKAHFGSPALSFYATIGLEKAVKKVDVSGGIALGYTTLSGNAELATTDNDLIAADGGGLYAGLNLGIAYRIARPLSIGIRTGVQYYSLNVQHPQWDGSTSLLAIPVALAIGLHF